MKVVILCGGLGTRLREETEFRPKPMVPVGGRPMLWHIMKYYAHFGHRDFILCLGYKGEVIKKVSSGTWLKARRRRPPVCVVCPVSKRVTFQSSSSCRLW